MADRKISIPEWFERLPENAKLNMKEVADIYGYHNRRAFYDAMRSGKAIANDGLPLPLAEKEESCHGQLAALEVIQIELTNQEVQIERPNKGRKDSHCV